MPEARAGIVILCCGSRGWTNRDVVRSVLSEYSEHGGMVLHGGAYGADTICGEVADDLGFATQVFRPEWSKFGPSAGLKRNLQMLDEGPDLVIAFWDGRSGGTEFTMRNAERRGIDVRVVREARVARGA